MDNKFSEMVDMVRSPSIEAAEDLTVNLVSFMRHLGAENLSPKTQRTYGESVRQFVTYLESQGMPRLVANIRREHVEDFVLHLLETRKPATANNRYRGLQAFWKWAVGEGEVKESPMARMKPPMVPDSPPDVLRDEQLKALLNTCDQGQDFKVRRDAALLRVFIDTGARLAEVKGLRWVPDDDTQNDVDLDRGILRVLGKGRRERILAIGRKTVRAIDRYLRQRRSNRDSHVQQLWLGAKGKGPLTDSGIGQAIRPRGYEAGIGKIHPHQLRHSFAHSWLA